MNLLGRHGLTVEDAEITDFYGGSVLAFASKSGNGQSDNMKTILADEAEAGYVGAGADADFDHGVRCGVVQLCHCPDGGVQDIGVNHTGLAGRRNDARANGFG